jgi:hypothetical protein
MLMAAVAYNLKKLLKFTTRKVETDVKALQERLQNSFSRLLALINSHRTSITSLY